MKMPPISTTTFGALPDNLLHSVLEWLPFQSVLRFRCVCKQWKALFASPAFHHLASHRAHVPPLIFFVGSSVNSDALYDDDDDNDHDQDYADYVSDDNGSDDNGSDDNDLEHGDQEDMDVVMRSGDHEDMHDVARYGDHGDMDHVPSSADSYGDSHCNDHFMRGDGEGDQRSGDHDDIHYDVMRNGDHGDMDDVLSYDDLGDMHDAIGHDDHGHDLSNGRVNDEEAPEEHTDFLLLIFDCESESWRRPLALPSGFTVKSSRGFLSRFHACTSQEVIMLSSISPRRLFLFNPASPPCKELPPRIAIQNVEAFGFVEERATLPGAVIWSNLSDLLSMSNEREPGVQEKTAKILHVVAVGDTVNDHHIVERFDSVTGSWHVIGHLPYSDDYLFIQMRMPYCNGCFYALVCSGVFIISNFQVGQNMNHEFQEFPDLPNGDGGLNGGFMEVVRWDIVATRESVFLIGVTSTKFPSTFQQGDSKVLLWQFHPHAPADARWELHAYMPPVLWRTLIGDIPLESGIRLETIMEYLAHGDLIFFMVPNRQCFLIYDVSQKLWRFSANCEYFLEVMAFVWEPLLRN